MKTSRRSSTTWPRGLALAALLAAVAPTRVNAQNAAPVTPPATPPTLEQVRSEMGIASHGDVRGQKDSIGFAFRADQMAKVWELSATPPAPDSFGPVPAPGVAAVICPHDDYLYAGRVYRRVLPLITAKTVVLVGVFHRYRRFAAHDQLVFDPYRTWRTPDGEAPVSKLREDLLRRLPAGSYVQDAAMHDSEHSLEALVYWLRHLRPDLEIVPIIVPVASFDRLSALSDQLGKALLESLAARKEKLGRDVAIAISTDGIHYGPDFKQTAFGEGGIQAYSQAVDKELGLMRGPLTGPVTAAKARELFATFVNPDSPNDYRWTWCGRFSVPFGLLLVERLARESGGASAQPIAYATSVGWPELSVRDLGIGATAPASLYHFVGYPAVAFTLTGR
jgi:AmmeMemoRadiSam system protein B